MPDKNVLRNNAREIAESKRSTDDAARRFKNNHSESIYYAEEGDKLQRAETKMQTRAAEINRFNQFQSDLSEARTSREADRLLAGAMQGEYGRDVYKFACDVKMSQEVSRRSGTEPSARDREIARSHSQSSGEGDNGWILGLLLIVIVVIVLLAIFGI